MSKGPVWYKEEDFSTCLHPVRDSVYIYGYLSLCGIRKHNRFLCFLSGCTLFDFEHGLSGWMMTGTAFNNQPTYGDNPTARNKSQPSKHKGDWWIGGYENRPSPSHPAGQTQGDGPQGTLTSPSFVIRERTFKFLIGGSCRMAEIRAELLIEGNMVLQATGGCSESMIERSWDVRVYENKEAQLRLVDDHSGDWGHINFDHFEEVCS